MTHEERQRRIRELADRLTQRLAEHWPESGADINDLEDFAERMGQDVQREIIERTLPEEAERKDGNQSACPCGGAATLAAPHPPFQSSQSFQETRGVRFDDREAVAARCSSLVRIAR